MRRLLSVLGVCGLLVSLLVSAGSPAAAATTAFTAINEGSSSLDVVATSACSTEEASVPAASSRVLHLDTACNYSVVATDTAGLCVVAGRAVEEDVWSSDLYALVVDVAAAGASPDQWQFEATGDCAVPKAVIEIEKNIDSTSDALAGALTTFTFVVIPYDLANSKSLADGGPCSDQSTHSGEGDTNGPGSISQVTVVNEYVAKNVIAPCSYSVTEQVPTGWTLTDADYESDCQGTNIALPDEATVIVTPEFSSPNDNDCEVEFTNDLDPVPLAVTKTFVGREYYTTVDRAAFHIYTPGLCGTVAIDPFGGLLGNVGVFRTINASQQTQVVLALPDTPVAGPRGACTYRVQENGTPDGCVPVAPEGSDADGAYWEQTWVPGETTELTFHIVNDCTPPEPTPDPTTEPTVDPTTDPDPDPDPGAKKPGGDLKPKFTG